MACGLLLESGSHILLEDGFLLTDEGSGGWLLLEDGGYFLLESGDKVYLEAIPCISVTTTTVSILIYTSMFIGKRRAIGHHQRGTRQGITTLSVPRVGS